MQWSNVTSYFLYQSLINNSISELDKLLEESISKQASSREDHPVAFGGPAETKRLTRVVSMSSPSSEELLQRVDDLTAELD